MYSRKLDPRNGVCTSGQLSPVLVINRLSNVFRAPSHLPIVKNSFGLGLANSWSNINARISNVKNSKLITYNIVVLLVLNRMTTILLIPINVDRCYTTKKVKTIEKFIKFASLELMIGAPFAIKNPKFRVITTRVTISRLNKIQNWIFCLWEVDLTMETPASDFLIGEIYLRPQKSLIKI
jgi:hypothetical protein